MNLERNEIQGLVLHGYRMPHAQYAFYRFDTTAGARRWLLSLAEFVTTAQPWPRDLKPPSCMNVALTYPGLVALGLRETDLVGFSPEFREGMAARAVEYLRDWGPSAPANWEATRPAGRTSRLAVDAEPLPPPFRERGVHALVMVFATEPDKLARQLEQLDATTPPGVELVGRQPGGALLSGREHFGYRDGMSQPVVAGAESAQVSANAPPPTRKAPSVRPGEFVLGYPDQAGGLPPMPARRELGRNSSYLVYRKLYQDVAAFRRFLRAEGARQGGEELLAAKIVGRWPSGAPLVRAPEYDDPDLARTTDFDYRDDVRGVACPKGAHVRRANPRSEAFQSDRHLLIRRGMPYGTPLPEGVLEDDGDDRGLVGVFINASIERQFEFVQRAWINNRKFDRLSNDDDPLVGSRAGGGNLTIQAASVPRRIAGLPRFVTVRGGEYFYLPSMTALRFLGGGAG